jgi:hypothetical protein
VTLHDPAGRRIYGIDNAHAVRLPFILIRCYMAEIDHELEVLLGLDGKNVDITALGRDIRELHPGLGLAPDVRNSGNISENHRPRICHQRAR